MQYGPFVMSKDFDRFARKIHDLFGQGRVVKARNDLAKKRAQMGITGKIVNYFLEGEHLVLFHNWHEALVCFKEAWKLTRQLPLTNRKEQLAFLVKAYCTTLFFSLPTQKALAYACKASQRQGFGLEFLKNLTTFSQRQGLKDREVGLCDIMLEQTHDREEKAGIALIKGQALANQRRLKEAKSLFQMVARMFPANPIPYEWLGAFFLLEGSDKASYFLRTAWKLGGRAVGFCRNLLIACLLEKRYDGHEELLDRLAQETDQALHLFLFFLRDLHPHFLTNLHHNLGEFRSRYQAASRRPNRHMRFLKTFKEEVDFVFDRYEEIRVFVRPLIQTYWKRNIPEQATYQQCLEFLEEHKPEEIESFREAYGKAFDPAEFNDFLTGLQEKGRLVTLVLLSFTHIVETIMDACGELGQPFDYGIGFDLELNTPYSFRGDTLILSGVSLFFLEDEASFKEEVKKLIRQDN